MTDQICIRLDKGGGWEAEGLGFHIDIAHAADHRAGRAPHCALLDLVEEVLAADGMPETIGDGEWQFAGWQGGDVAVYERAQPTAAEGNDEPHPTADRPDFRIDSPREQEFRQDLAPGVGRR